MSKYGTPMMQQYLKLKEAHDDCLLLFRLGDFYELFEDDAKIGANVLDITLTARDRGKDGKIPMAGVPYHALDSYLYKLVKAGHKVAICEQVSAPEVGSLVEREVVRIVTPGTLLDDSVLGKKENNYVVSISVGSERIGFAFSDLSTGEFLVSEHVYDKESLNQVLSQELGRFSPSECVLHDEIYNDPVFLKRINFDKSLNIYPFQNWDLFAEDLAKAHNLLEDHFKVASLQAFSLHEKEQASLAAAALLGYLKHTQKNNVQHVQRIREYSTEKNVEIDRATVTNLEIFSTLRDGHKSGSLVDVIDGTKTAMGGRLLKRWLMQPSYSITELRSRYDIIDSLREIRDLRAATAAKLSSIYDLERMLSKISVGLGNARDLVNLKTSLQRTVELKDETASLGVLEGVSPELSSVIKTVDKFIVNDPPIDLKEGGLIKKGINTKIDELRETISEGKDWIANLEVEEKKRTGVGSLKVKYNKVFGYYIEISKSNLDAAPENYIRKQTLVNAERFITPELKEVEEQVLNAKEELKEIEYKLYLEVVQEVMKFVQDVQGASRLVAYLDCLVNFSEIADKNNYVRPDLNEDGVLDIKDGRHPVIERLVERQQFVPNDVYLDTDETQLMIITGPNMAGKSVYLRQVALIVLLSHIGCFVPAKSANISITDRIFVRSGASDMISRGLSTFMVEMIEAAYILNHATKESLIIMDEIGRGTSTYDGISIASAIAEYIVTQYEGGGPKTLFATHYHELQDLENTFKGIKNYQVVVKHENGEPVFIHKVVPGGASHSFGVAVAKLAGVPEKVVSRAKNLLAKFEKSTKTTSHKEIVENDSTEEKTSEVERLLEEISVDDMTPIAALTLLSKLKEMTDADN